MAQWFECKVKYDKTTGEAQIKTVSETYLVDAMSFTEAEARITEEVKYGISGEFKVDSVKRVRMSEIFFDENGDKCIEKRTGCYMYVQASDFAKALQNLMDGMKGTMSDFEVASIAETVILDVFKEDLSGAKAE